MPTSFIHSLILLLFAARLAAPCVALSAGKSVVFYDSVKAKEYAIKWCSAGNECSSGKGGQFDDEINSDCTHFMAHILDAGGVTVAGSPEASCAKGLSIRVIDLGKWFADAAEKNVNVRKLPDWQSAKAGDFCFLEHFRWREFSIAKSHAMLLSAPVTTNGAKVYSHSNQHCGEDYAYFNPAEAVFYRIDASPYDGNWQSTDPERRFSLAIRGKTATWTESRKADQVKLKREIKLEEASSGGFILKRAVDDEVLRFLDFSNPTLRQAILAHNPPASTISLEKSANGLSAQWRGLLVRKKADGSFQDIVPIGQVPAKAFLFSSQ